MTRQLYTYRQIAAVAVSATLLLTACSTTGHEDATLRRPAVTNTNAPLPTQPQQSAAPVSPQIQVINSLLNELDRLEARIATVENNTMRKDDFNKLQQLLQVQIASVRSEAALKSDLEALRAQQQQNGGNAQLESRLLALSDVVNGLRGQVNAISGRTDANDGAIATLQNAVDSVRTSATVTTANTQLQNRVTALNDAFAALREQMTTTTGRIDGNEVTVTALQQAVDALQNEWKTQQQRATDATNIAGDRFESRLIALSDAVTVLRSQTADAARRIDDNAGALSAARQDMTSLAANVRLLQGEVSRLRQDTAAGDDIRRSVADVQRNVDALRSAATTVYSVRDQLLTINDQLNTLENRKADVSALEQLGDQLQANLAADVESAVEGAVDKQTLRNVHVELLESIDWIDRQYKKIAADFDSLLKRITRLEQQQTVTTTQ